MKHLARINLIKNQLKSNKSKSIVSSAYDYFDFDAFLNKSERGYRKTFREFLKNEVECQINTYIEKREFPKELILKIIDRFPGIMGFSLKGYGSAGYSHWMTWTLLMELARCDLSLATFFLVNGGELVMKVIHQLGNETQRLSLLPKMNTLEIMGSFCLTEPEHGSDASNLTTNIREINNGRLVLNGNKRWIGNASNAQILIVFARNDKNKKVEGYLVDSKLKGVDIKIMEGKCSTRGVQNCDISFTNVELTKENKLDKITDFHKVSSKTLFGSRLSVAWITVGALIGTYDRVIEYCSKRQQFGKSISSFQLIQEKIVKIMADTQAMLYFCKRSSELFLQGSLTIGGVGMLKSWCTTRARETLRVARESLGGNGILLENWIMKTMLDMESLHTYEGTADINMLVCGKELTGINAIK